MKKAFTLAEVMIVLTVIGVLTAILLPVARQSMPDKDLMKFKKAHNTLGTAIRELVTSDKYYLDGDLGIRADGQVLHQGDESFNSYLIASFADVLSLNYYSPKIGRLDSLGYFYTAPKGCASADTASSILDNCSNIEATRERFSQIKVGLDGSCKKSPSSNAKQVVTNDGVWYWDPFPQGSFGAGEKTNGSGRRFFHMKDKNGFYALYKIFCMDIDGVPDNATSSDCVNECPFTYGIRVDGQVFTSQRADEWLARDVNEE